MASNAPTQLPAYIQLRYEENGVFDKFESAAEYAADRAKKRFDKAFAETEKTVSGAVSRMSSEFGKLDLGVGNMRQQAAEIRLYRDTLQQVSIEAQRLARETGDTSTATREYLRALQTQRSEATRALQVAEAQVTTYTRLQTALDGSAAANDRLAESQRGLYAEQARASRVEVAARDRQNLYAVGFDYDEASERQRQVNRSSRQSDLESAFSSYGYKPSVDTRDSVQKILDGNAAMDRAAISGTTLEQVLGRVATKGQEVAAAHSKMARETEQAAADQTKLALAVERLHGELDPVVAATQRYAADVKILDQALAAGAISEERHAAMMVKVNEASRDGTTAFRSVINSSGAVRVALLQSGQQMQDFAIQVYSGQSATVAMAQQLPQLAFALSGLEGHTNKTYDKIGQFATFLSGPWGLAVGLGVGVLGTLAVELLGAGNEAEKATTKTYDFSRSIDVLGLSAKSTADAMSQLAQATKAAIAEQGDYLENQASVAGQAVTDIEKEMADKRKQLSQLVDQTTSFSLLPKPFVANQIATLRDELKTLDVALNDARQSSADASIALSQRRVTDSLDPATAAVTRYKKALGELDIQRRKSIALDQSGDLGDFADKPNSYLSESDYEKRLAALKQIRDAAIQAAADAKKASNEVDRQFGREINLDAAKSIASTAGFTVTSDLRTRAEQQRLYDTVRTPTNPVARPGTSAHESGNALDIAFGKGVSESSIKKAYADAGVKLTKLLKEDGHFHIEWSTKGADKVVREAEAVAKAQQQLKEFGERSAESIARINERFDEQPRLIDQTTQATRQLDAIIADLADRKPPGFEQMIADAKEAKATVEDALVRPFREMLEDSERRLQVQTLLAQGRADEAAAVQEIWRFEDANYKLTEAQKDAVRDLVSHEQRRTRELERQRDLFEAQLDVLDQAKRSLTDLLSGRSTNFFKDMTQALKDLQGKRLFDSLFGDTFQQLEDQLRGQSPLGKESSHLAREMTVASSATEDLAMALEDLAMAFKQGAAAIRKAAANDNTGDQSMVDGGIITVTPMQSGLTSATLGHGIYGLGSSGSAKSKTAEVDISNMSVVELAFKMGGAIVEPLQSKLDELLGTRFGQMMGGVLTGVIAGKMAAGNVGAAIGGMDKVLQGLGVDTSNLFGSGKGLGGALEGAAYGNQLAGIRSALGMKGSTTGAQISGAIGSFLPGQAGLYASAVQVSDMVGQGLSDVLGIKYSKTAGGIFGALGGIIGGLFKHNTTARALITNGSGYSIGGADSGGYDTASGLGDSVIKGLNSIVDQLGGSIGSFLVGIGTRGDEYRVNPNGGSLKLDNGAISFGDDAEAAIAFAIKNAIEDGAITGMRQSTINIIKAGDDLDAALQDALDWENVFRELKSYKDPIGAALDDLDKQFEKYIDLAKTAGASTQEMADLEELYGIKRNEIIKQQAEQLIGSLQSLYTDLTTGDNGLSLRDRQAAAETTYDDLAARVAAGDTTAYDDYATAAQTLLDIERELYGSQQEYFDRLNEVTDLTKTRIDAETNVVSIAENRDSPFDATGAVKSSIDVVNDTLVAQLSAANLNYGTMISLLAQIAANGGTASAASVRLALASSF